MDLSSLKACRLGERFRGPILGTKERRPDTVSVAMPGRRWAGVSETSEFRPLDREFTHLIGAATSTKSSGAVLPPGRAACPPWAKRNLEPAWPLIKLRVHRRSHKTQFLSSPFRTNAAYASDSEQ